MAKRRRTQQIQRRGTRASEEALNRPLTASRGFDPRLLIIGGILVVGVIVLIVVMITISGPNPSCRDVCRRTRAVVTSPTGPTCGPVTRAHTRPLPGTSGPHWTTPNNWGVYTQPQAESQLIHNLEHGGIVIWYQAGSAGRRGPRSS